MRKPFLLTILLSLAGCMVFISNANAQSLPVGSVFDDQYRVMQLMGKVDSNVSFTVRPISSARALKVSDIFDPDSTLKRDHWVQAGPVTFANGHGIFRVMPFNWQQQYNSDHPYGWNDGPMIPAKGYQTMVSGGFFFQLGPLSIQLQPEYVYAANNAFTGFASGHTALDLKNYYTWYNNEDAPERFGTTAYKKAFWGQSSIRINFNAFSAGISTEDMWWGPGIRNSLILSDNAPGFAHLTLNTRRPAKTFLGYFEGQVFAGRLNDSGFQPLNPETLPPGTNYYLTRPTDWRYFTGININYHPKWIPGLTLGFIRTFDAYEKYVTGFGGYFPFFFPYSKDATANVQGDPFPRDQYTSFYGRYLFKEAQAEVYFEYGLNDNSYNLRDFVQSPDHSRAYIIGGRKVINLNGKTDEHILVSAEITQLSQSMDRYLREADGWYMHSTVVAGQTNEGQVLGAGTGTGGNLQSMDVSWISGLKKLGISLERYEHNVDLYQLYFPDINGNSRNWVDLAVAATGQWSYKNLIFTAKLQHITSYNYEWILKNYTPGQYYIPNNTVNNFHGELGMTFRF